MAKVIYDVGKIQNWIEEKQQLEVMLAWDLLERFNSASMIGPLRAMANAAIKTMVRMPTAKVKDAIQDERKYANMQYLANQLVLSASRGGRPIVLTVNNQEDLAGIWDKNPMPDAQYCSDIIRLFGTCVEKCGGQLAAKKLEYRGGGRGPWADGKDRGDPITFGRHRSKGKNVPFAPVPGWTDVGLLSPEVRAQKEREFQNQKPDPRLILAQRAQKQIDEANISKVQRFLIYQQGGQSVIAMTDQSTVARINRVFGTVPASDISGTTADTLFFFDQMKGSFVNGQIDPVYYVLPAATIVAGAHHSLLEVALALSLKYPMTKIDYHIGFYTTLLPEGATINRGEILESLVAAEKHRYNHHMLIFYKGPNVIDGCFKFEYDESGKFNRNFAQVTDVERRFRTMRAWPTEEDIHKTWQARYFFEAAA